MNMRVCGHSARIENSWSFKIPVYLERDPSAAGILIAPQPDYYIERSYCLECMIQKLDKMMQPPWWLRALKWCFGEDEE
jgi:hypothetical protein